jgi:hypothetical protein
MRQEERRDEKGKLTASRGVKTETSLEGVLEG